MFCRRLKVPLRRLRAVVMLVLASARLSAADWPVKTPAEVGLDQTRLEKMAVYLGGRGMVVRHGCEVFAWGDVAKRGDVASAAKPFYSHLLWRAVELGKLAGVDTKLADFEPRLRELNPALGHKDAGITFRQAANQTSCYGVGEDPGTAFDYNDQQMALFWDTLFLKVYGAGLKTIDRDVFQPLLTGLLGCQDDPTMLAFGSGDRPGRVAISPRDFCRFGLLYLRGGVWNGTRLLDADHVRQATTSPLPLTLPRTKAVAAEQLPGQRTIGSARVPDDQTSHLGCYSWLWWINGVRDSGRRLWPHAPPDTFCALGHENGQRGLAVMPSLDIVMSWNDTTLGDRPWEDQAADDHPLDEAFRLLVPVPTERPNIVFILADDLGASDLGCTGSTFHQTPHLDRLARESLTFTSAYSACTVCSPTRACLMTGKYPARLHVTDWIAGHRRPYAKLKVPDWTMHLAREEMKIGRVFHDVGRPACAIGKWHLGGGEFSPDRQGFDINLTSNERGQPPSYVAPYGIPAFADAPAGEFLTDREAAEACHFIEANKDRPFFLYLAPHAVHTPLTGKADVIAKFKAKANPDAPQRNPTYAALLESLDDAVGRVRAKLDELKLSERTIVIFTSDNGGLLGSPNNPITSNPPFRAGKGSAYEGGVRVPLFVHWPGVTKAGSRCDVPVQTVDFYPTLLEMAGLDDAPDHHCDGESLVPLLRQTGPLKRDALFWHYPHYHPGGASPHGAIREGQWRLVEFFEDQRAELYDLANDPGEQHDLAASQPEKAHALRLRLAEWRRSVGAQMPAPNPDYDAARDSGPNAWK